MYRTLIGRGCQGKNGIITLSTGIPMLLFAIFLLAGAQQAPGGMPASAYAARRAAALDRLGSDLLIVPSRASFLADDQLGYVQAPDFQYLTGLDHLVGAVLVLDGGSKASVLFTARPARLVNRWIVSPGAESARQLGMTEVLSVDSLSGWLARRFRRPPARVYVSSVDTRGAVETPIPMAGTVERWRHFLAPMGAATIGPAVPIVRPLRDIKSAEELAVLRRVGRTSGEAFLAGIRALRPGRWQREAELEVVAACTKAGARGVSFWPWTMSGPTAVFTNLFDSFQDYEHVNRQMQAGEVVRVDVGCQIDHYMGDVGRTAPVSGRFDPGQREAWDLFIAGYRAGLLTIRDGAPARAVFEAATAEIKRLQPGLKTALGRKAAETLLGPGGTGPWELHGVGLDDAEGEPETLRAGMTVAYELMFAVEGQGYYLEDMIAITKDGHEVLTPGLPYTASEIEAAMKATPAGRGSGAVRPASRR
ncbi:MAG: aminopeptidase P N-terminal domain-containing protein [Gemmatimonadota bacterium]